MKNLLGALDAPGGNGAAQTVYVLNVFFKQCTFQDSESKKKQKPMFGSKVRVWISSPLEKKRCFAPSKMHRSSLVSPGEEGDIVSRSIVCTRDGKAVTMPPPPQPTPVKPKAEKPAEKKEKAKEDPLKAPKVTEMV